MESFIQDYIPTTLRDDLNVEEEILLDRHLSPYATLRPGNVEALIRFQGSLQVAEGTAQMPTPLSLKDQKSDAVSDDNDDDSEFYDDTTTLRCLGVECNHIPAEYLVTGLRRHEMPVIGVYVDNRICPGFKYRVRRIGTNGFLFENEAKTLESIGMGYGRRLTFTGDSMNCNDCFFWSDSEPKGFAFSIQTVEDGQRLSIMDSESVVVGEGVVDNVDGRQEEISMQVDQAGNVSKRVQVRMLCKVKYHFKHNHGLLELMLDEKMEAVCGEAVILKKKRSRKASLVAIENVILPRYGQCRLVPES